MSELLSNVTLGTAETKCFHVFPPSMENFITVFGQKLDFVVNDSINRINGYPSVCNPLDMWKKIMELIPSNLHPAYQDRDACEKLVACLASLGTNCLLHKDKNLHVLIGGLVAQTILFVETVPREAQHDLDFHSKLRDLWGGDDEREVTKFFHKRNSCNCLKEKYERLKTQTKMGQCIYCEQSYERKKLMICTQCQVAQYCSAECQRGHWPSHRDGCIELHNCTKQQHADHTP
jgi:hypothetical protein